MNKHKVPSAFSQRKLSTNQNIKPIEISRRLNVQFENDTLSMSHVNDTNFFNGREECENKAIQYEYTSQKVKLFH